MEIAESKGDLRSVKLGFGFGEASLLRKVFEELAALDELHDEVYSVGLLEDVIHSDHEGVVHLLENEVLHLKALY